ncbi:unknown [Corallococcus sp. CAG:1435]|nr:unknown [Corallococcus sp. CAG:1435]
MISAQPNVSTAVILRMKAFFLLMLVTPMDSTMVTTVANPSGMDATASPIATMKLSRTTLPSKPFIIRLKAKITTQIPITTKVRILLSDAIFS